MKKGLRKFVKIDDGTGRKLILRTQYPSYIFEINPENETDVYVVPLSFGRKYSIATRKDFHQQGEPSEMYKLEALRYYVNDILKNQPEKYVKSVDEGTADVFRDAMVAVGIQPEQKPYDKQDLYDLLNASYLAEKCFDKSRQWFYQRVNESTVNGRQAAFTENQKVQLAAFLRQKASEILLYADDLSKA